MTVYLFDTNVLIQAKNLHYGFDFCPAFWDWIIENNKDGKVASVQKVFDEIHRPNIKDRLANWAEKRGTRFFLKPDDGVSSALIRVSNWAFGQEYTKKAINRFLVGADPYLIAHAIAYGCTVVTHEQFSESHKKIKIPNACIDLGVPCIDPFVMLRKEQAQFVLHAKVDLI